MEFAYNGQLVLINIFLWFILILSYRRGYTCCGNKGTRGYGLLFIMMTLFSTYAFCAADTYHYHEIYNRMQTVNGPVHVEQVYFWLLKVLPKDYYLWRLIIWGLASLCLILTYKRYKLNPQVAAFTTAVVLLYQFSITRGCLGISLFLLSSSFFLKPINGKKLISYILGIAGCGLSLYFHRSMFVFICMFLLAYIPINKFSLFLSLLIFPILRIRIVPAIESVTELLSLGDDMMRFTNSYIKGEQLSANIRGIIQQVINLLPCFISVYILIKANILRSVQGERYIKMLSRYTFILFYVSMLFYGLNVSAFMSSRILHMMYFPLTIVLSHTYVHNEEYRSLIRKTMIFFFVSVLYSTLLSMYTWW